LKPFLLLQARMSNDPMRDHEHGCFAAALGVSEDDIAAVDIVRTPPTAEILEGVKAVLIGGSGSFSARGNEPWLQTTTAFLREDVIGAGRPMFGVCFGLQLLGRTLGVDVIHDPDRREVGTFEVEVFEAAQSCELFNGLPKRMLVQQGHNDRIVALPEGTTHLATSERASVQAMKVIGKPVWATQFHPELSRRDNAMRYKRYISAYGGGSPQPDDPVMSSLRDTPSATDLLRRFGQLVLDNRI